MNTLQRALAIIGLAALLWGVQPQAGLLWAAGADSIATIAASPDRPDSLYFQLLQALEGKKVKVRLVEGGSRSGLYAATDSGLVLSEAYFANGLTAHKTRRVDFIPWREIESIEVSRHKVPWPLIYLFGFVGSVLLAAEILGMAMGD